MSGSDLELPARAPMAPAAPSEWSEWFTVYTGDVTEGMRRMLRVHRMNGQVKIDWAVVEQAAKGGTGTYIAQALLAVRHGTATELTTL